MSQHCEASFLRNIKVSWDFCTLFVICISTCDMQFHAHFLHIDWSNSVNRLRCQVSCYVSLLTLQDQIKLSMKIMWALSVSNKRCLQGWAATIGTSWEEWPFITQRIFSSSRIGEEGVISHKIQIYCQNSAGVYWISEIFGMII